MILEVFLKYLKCMGISGVQNFPTVGPVDGRFRAYLEYTKLGYATEVNLIRQARQTGLFTCPLASGAHNAKLMAKAGADCIILHGGVEPKSRTKKISVYSLNSRIEWLQKSIHSIAEVNPEIITLFHPGTAFSESDLSVLLKRVEGLHGFFYIPQTRENKLILAELEILHGVRPA